MKNLKLKQKFLVGFGVPVLLVVLIAISVIFTNLSVMKSIQETTSAASLSEYGRVIQKNFLSAQIYSRAIQEQTTYNEVDLKNFEKEIQLAIETLEEASDFASSDEELKLFTSDFEASKESFNLYSAIVSRYVELFKNNIDPSVEELNRTGEVVVEEFSILKDGYLDRLTNEAGNYEKILSRSYKFEKLLTAMAGLSELRVKVEHQIKRYVPENNAEITAINAEILDLADMGLKSAHNDPDNIKAAWESIIDAQNAYQNAYDEYAKALEEQLELKTQLHDTSEETEIRLERVINDVAVRSGEIGESSQQTAITALAIVISITAVTVVVSIIMARRLTESISVPLSHITEILGQIGGKGQVEFSETQLEKMHVIGRGKDEIAKSVKMLELTADRLGLIGEKLRLISDGDLSFKMNSLSSEDVLGRAGRRMLKNLNRMFRDINYTADKILSDAKKITEVSEILASGASEQAASIEEISEGIGLIFANTKANEEMTEKAVMLASEIKQNADKSTDEMAELMRAVNEISESSDEIANVIGTIDSIAFQTNLLALNAATEAARAGFYGKGFAVVAGEVRRLAIQSSAAAKETHDLIEKSLAKTKQGRVIAETTADSLAEIVMGITASTDIINKIAQCSGEQTSSIYVINEKLANIIDVVQETSRTASESAESAAGLNDQAAILTEHTDKFKLRYD